MTTNTDTQTAATATPEIARMVRELEARHGHHAASVARFIAEFNEQNGRVQQSLSWRRVCEGIEARTLDRLRQRINPANYKPRLH